LAELVNLESLRCNNNQLSKLNVGELQKLETFDCSYNYLTTLNISGLKNLRLLRCHNNNLTHLYIKNGKSPFNWQIIPNQSLNYVCCDENEVLNLKDHLSVYGIENFEINSNCP
jgi:Leucine-rich repeat (LRR) protein